MSVASDIGRRAACLASLALALLLPTGARLRSPGTASAAPASPLAADKGKFKILVNGQEVGQEEFEISQSGGLWSIRGTSTLRGGKVPTRVSGNLQLHPDGVPVHYDWSTDGEKKASAVISFNNATASVELHSGTAAPYTQQFTFASPMVVVLDNNLYHQYAVLARLYDWSKKGVQSFAVIVPQEMTPGNVTVESLGKQDSGGKQLDELRVRTEDLELDLFLDGQRLMRIAAPASDAEIIRQ
jgi:hypothetical protein